MATLITILIACGSILLLAFFSCVVMDEWSPDYSYLSVEGLTECTTTVNVGFSCEIEEVDGYCVVKPQRNVYIGSWEVGILGEINLSNSNAFSNIGGYRPVIKVGN
jgi:hypothetical protein